MAAMGWWSSSAGPVSLRTRDGEVENVGDFSDGGAVRAGAVEQVLPERAVIVLAGHRVAPCSQGVRTAPGTYGVTVST